MGQRLRHLHEERVNVSPIVIPMVIGLSTNLNGSDPICVSALRKWTELQGVGAGMVVGDLFQDP